jgi:phenylacetate-CoA ligase
MATQDYHNDLEIRDPAERERDNFAEFGRIFAAAKERAPGVARVLDRIDPRDIDDRAALSALPVTRKSELVELQQNDIPFGGFTTVGPGDLHHSWPRRSGPHLLLARSDLRS